MPPLSADDFIAKRKIRRDAFSASRYQFTFLPAEKMTAPIMMWISGCTIRNVSHSLLFQGHFEKLGCLLNAVGKNVAFHVQWHPASRGPSQPVKTP